MPADPLLLDTEVFGADIVPGAAGDLDPDVELSEAWFKKHRNPNQHATDLQSSPKVIGTTLPDTDTVAKLAGSRPLLTANADAKGAPPTSRQIPLWVRRNNVDGLIHDLVQKLSMRDSKSS